tara:strand:+ start:82 stop:930 length:849 start_codon:yes stop_codon:yes gene_type:complete
MTLQNETAGFSDNGTANGTANGTTPPVEAEVEGTGTLEQQTPVADGLATTSPEDSNAQQPTIETLQTQLKKLENDNKALQGRLRSQQKENPQFDELSDNMATLVDTVQALIRHQSTQDQEAYMEDLQKVEANAATRKATNNFTRTANSFIAEIEEIVTESGLDLMTAPELAAFRELWSPAYEKQDLAGIYQAHAEFNRTMRRIERDRRLTEKDQLTKAAEDRVRKFAEENGLNTLDLDSTSSAPSNASANNLLTRMGDSNTSVSREEIAQAAEVLRKQGIRI